MSSSVVAWLNDRLHSVLGLSDTSIAQYLSRQVQAASAPDVVLKQLQTDGIAVTEDLKELVAELHARLHGGTPSTAGPSGQKRSRRGDPSSSDSEGEGPALLPKQSRVADAVYEQDEESVRLRDLQERDEFAQRLRQKDDDRTRHSAPDTRDKKAFEEAAKRLELEKEDRNKILPKLRVESRRKYLAKRKDEKIKELAGDIADDEYLFEEDTLTEQEKRTREYKKTILKLATDYDKVRDQENAPRYALPSETTSVDARYVEVDDGDRRPHAEQRRWEEEQMKGTALTFGAKDKAERYKKQTKEYHLVLEDEIEFIKSLPLPGTRKKKKKKKRKKKDDEGSLSSSSSSEEEDAAPRMSAAAAKAQSIAEVRRSLPVFPFKEALLEAVEQHQCFGHDAQEETDVEAQDTHLISCSQATLSIVPLTPSITSTPGRESTTPDYVGDTSSTNTIASNYSRQPSKKKKDMEDNIDKLLQATLSTLATSNATPSPNTAFGTVVTSELNELSKPQAKFAKVLIMKVLSLADDDTLTAEHDIVRIARDFM